MSRAALVGLLVILSAATGCGSSPPSTFYALSPKNGATAAAAPLHAIKLRRPGLAGYLDRPEIVHTVVDFKLGVTDTDRWGAPLDEMLGRVLAEDIEQRLPGSSVFTEDGPITATADATVEVDIRRFDVGADGEVTLMAEVAAERASAHGVSATRAVNLHQRPASASTPALVASMSDLLGQLADQIAALLRAG